MKDKMLGLKLSDEEYAEIDKLINKTRTGLVPGHYYKSRADLVRAGLERIKAEVKLLTSDRAAMIAAFEKMLDDGQDEPKEGGNGLD